MPVKSQMIDPRNRSARFWSGALLFGTVLVVAALGMSGCAHRSPVAAATTARGAQASIPPPIKPQIAYAIIAINDLEPNIATAEVTVTLSNSNPSEASVHSFRWTVYYRDHGNWEELGQGNSESRQVQPNSATTFNWAVTGPVTSAGVAKFPKIDAFSSGQTVQLRASGSIPVDVGGSRFAVPFDISRDFPNSAQ